ncbi:hypothetical protein HAX54_032932 [Datura stramonium]|uniref:Dirigent protein n=1 Tax=Datura stramonium TaxID=4076 RepID=A0ABS8VF66_DATST|nr:hypothetical protein [Datura stramonium]
MTTKNNTKLSSLIDHMFEMIKRAIDKALALVHIKIQDLEHRVSALEEDDDFEDERVETHEENFEDAQTVKEVDEDREVQVATQRSMDDLTTQLMVAGTSSRTSEATNVATTTIVPTATTQSEEAGQNQEDQTSGVLRFLSNIQPIARFSFFHRKKVLMAASYDLEKEQIFSMAEKEMEYRVEMFNKLTHTCFKKCIENKYKDSELNMGENNCIDKCVSKYWQVNNLVGTLLGNTRPISAYSARILDEVTSLSDTSETDEPDVAPVVAPIATSPSGQLPATVTADMDVAPVADPSIPAAKVAPPADLPTEPEPDSAPVVAPAVSVAPPDDSTNTEPAPVTDAAPVATPVSPTPGGVTATSGGIAAASTSGAREANPVPDHPMFSFFMHDILGGSRPSGRVVTGIIANSDANNLPFSKPNNQIFPINGGVPVNTINNVVNNNNYPYLVGLNGQQQASTVLQNSGNNNIVNGGNNQPFVTAGQLPSGLSLQQLMFGSITVVDNEITEGHELGSAILGRAQGFYLTSSSDGTSHTLALTALFHGEHDHEVDHSISFFGIHRTATPISHIAIIGGTGKYENAKGYATIETLPHVDQHTTDGVETITHFTVYLTP